MNVGKLGPAGIQPQTSKSNDLLKPEALGKSDFSKALDNAVKGTEDQMAAEVAKKPIDIKFSNHAVDRMRSRGIYFQPDKLAEIDSAIKKAGEKGAKETLVIADNAAMIANVENKTIVTVMDKEMLKENVFTNIDAAVIV